MNKKIRREVAFNENAPPDVLKTLSTDENRAVRLVIVYNKNAPPDVLNILSTDEDETIRSGIAYNKNTPLDTLIQMYKDDRSDSYIRSNILSNLERRNIDIRNYLKENKKRNIDKLLNFLIE